VTAVQVAAGMKARVAAGFFVLLLALAGCANLPQSKALLRAPVTELPPRAEVGTVPFIAQDENQCGPAALAMTLKAAGLDVSLDTLTEALYLPARNGSLQVELLAAARRHGLLAYALEPELKNVLREIAAGNGVIVLQNLGLFAFFPYWHYAVVLGYDLERNEVLLHTGAHPRRAMPLRLFEFLWKDGGRWAMVALPPGRIPASAEEARLARAAAALEQTGHLTQARLAYGALLRRWPDNFVATMGLGTTAYALGRLSEAEAAFRAAAALRPRAGAAFNNLAQTLADQGHWDAALAAAQEAVRLGGPSLDAAQATLSSIRQSLGSKANDRQQTPRSNSR